MPDVLLRQDAHPQEEEDDAVAGGGQRLDGVLDRGEAFLADVLESIMLGSHSKADDADDSRPMEELSPKEGGICTAENSEWLHNSNVLCEPSDGAGEDAMKKSKECSSKSNGEEGEDCHEDVVAGDAPCEGGEGVHGAH